MKQFFFIAFIITVLNINAQNDYPPLPSGISIEKIREHHGVLDNNGKNGYIDRAGKTVIPFIYDGVGEFFEGLAAIKKGEKYGYIDTRGTIVIDTLFDDAFPFSEGLAAVKKDNKWGYIDKSGSLVIPYNYLSAEEFSDSIAFVENLLEEWCYINRKGKFLCKEEKNTYDRRNFSNHLYKFKVVAATTPVYEIYNYGYINMSGDTVIQPKYYDLSYFSEGWALAKSENDSDGVFIDMRGEIVLDPEYEVVSIFSEGLAAVNIQGLIGFINKKGKLVLKTNLEYESYGHDMDDLTFHEGLCVFRTKNWKMGYFNTKGEVVIPADYKYAAYFSNGAAWVSKSDGGMGSLHGYIDKDGNTLAEIKYYAMSGFKEGRILGLWQDQETQVYYCDVIDEKGNILNQLKHQDGMWPRTGFKNGVAEIFLADPPDQREEASKAYINREGKVFYKAAPNWICFPAGQKVLMAGLNEKPIEEIMPGDAIMSYNPEKETFEESQVVKVEKHSKTQQIYTISTSEVQNELYASLSSYNPDLSFVNISATEGHPFVTKRGIVRTKDLVEGDILFFYDTVLNKKKEIKVVNTIKETCENVTVYNLKTISGNYIVNGIVVLMK